jgi:signal transduction histidine kinase
VRRATDKPEPPPTLRWILHLPHAGPPAEFELPDERRKRLECALEDERRRRGEAEAALQRRNNVLAFVAHELRNPLSAAAGWLEILNREDLGQASQKHGLSVLERNIKSLSRMVEELVDQTRIVEDQITLECEQTDARALLERVCADARGRAEAKRQRFSCEFAAALGSVYCDPFRVQQALNNVIGNALKFTPTGGVVQLSARMIGETLEIAVHDSGPGIAQEHLRSIFDPFTRLNAHGATTGLGLGLNIARRLIELHAGSITAESEGSDRGSTFRVTLPRGGGPALDSKPTPLCSGAAS